MNLKDVVRRATAAIAKNKELATEVVYVPALDMELTFCQLTPERKAEIYEQVGENAYAWTKKMIYSSCDQLRELALELSKGGTIAEYEDAVGMFSEEERAQLLQLVTRLGKSDSTLVVGGKDAVKNS